MTAIPKAALLKSAICSTTAKCRPTPSLFHFPGLTSKPWHNPLDHGWVEELEKNYHVIKNEYLGLRELKIQSDYTLKNDEHSLHQGGWDWHSYILKGKRQQSFALHCPKTVEILENISDLMTGLPFAYAFFSTLKPGTQIAGHSAPCNLRLRCHFPLIVPSGCGIQVADEQKTWTEGKCLLFDDSYYHQVWHDGKDDRVVLLFDIWHPDLIDGEKYAIQQMFLHASEKGWLAQ